MAVLSDCRSIYDTHVYLDICNVYFPILDSSIFEITILIEWNGKSNSNKLITKNFPSQFSL